MNDSHRPGGAVLTQQTRGKAAWVVNEPAICSPASDRESTPKKSFLLLLLGALGALSV